MGWPILPRCRWLLFSLLLLALALPAAAEPPTAPWQALWEGKGLDAWKNPTADWIFTEGVEMDPDSPRTLKTRPGKGDILVNGPKGRTRDLLTRDSFGDIELHLEFLIPKGSNSGVKFHGHYEIQICDSFGVKTPSGSDCGGIYPRADLKPVYHYLDKGIPPKVNASRPPGEWQTLDAIFVAPRFGEDGKKTINARLVKAVLNDKIIHENVELKTPTGHAWTNKELATGPLLLQADHGPVAFRNVRVRPWKEEAKK